MLATSEPDPDGVEEEQQSRLGPDVVEHVVAGDRQDQVVRPGK